MGFLKQLFGEKRPHDINERIHRAREIWVEEQGALAIRFMNDCKAAGSHFELFSGAIFALHQDTLLKYTIDMWLTHDMALNQVWDRLRPSTLGKFPDRLMLVIQALQGIDNAGFDFIKNATAPPGIPQKEHDVTRTIASMCWQAARVWLMTIYSKMDPSETMKIEPGVQTAWLMLQEVPSAIVAKEAVNFSGNYYDVRTERFYPGRWPQNSMTPWAWQPPPPVTAPSAQIYLPAEIASSTSARKAP